MGKESELNPAQKAVHRPNSPQGSPEADPAWRPGWRKCADKHSHKTHLEAGEAGSGRGKARLCHSPCHMELWSSGSGAAQWNCPSWDERTGLDDLLLTSHWA